MIPSIRLLISLVLFLSALCARVTIADENSRIIDPQFHHLRHGAEREWSKFPEKSEGDGLVSQFEAAPNATEQTLRIRHSDLKFQWVIRINSKDVAVLPKDEMDMVTFWPVPAGTLHAGMNELKIACNGSPNEKTSDDVMIGDIALFAAPRQQVLSAASVDVTVADINRHEPLPCRLTVADKHGSLISTGNSSDKHLAVRPGIVYTGDGHAALSLPAGKFTLYAGRGFAYSLDSTKLDLRAGDIRRVKMSLRRMVQAQGYVSCDTHVHTFTYSRHGDASIEERMLTIAGEGIELPIATDHNLQIDYEAPAAATEVRKYFTPVIGDEVTTGKLGHFNVFPLAKEGHLLNWRAPTWAGLRRDFTEIAGDPIVVLNHARDTHGGFRPFDPSRHISCTGEDLDGWTVPANAMEVINSGATLTDPMQLYHDWFGMLNRGQFLTPIGSSDSHTVGTYIIGQGRTYIRCDGTDPSHIDVSHAIRSLHEGRVLVSYGLLADISVAEKFGPGDLVPADALTTGLDVTVRIFGPEWTKATSVTLFANGIPIRQATIDPTPHPIEQAEPIGMKFQTRWTLPRPKHDVWLTVIAMGPGVTEPYWPMNAPYQPTSPDYVPHVIGSSGAVRVDADGSGHFESAYDYADRIVKSCNGDAKATIAALADYDEATAEQAAGILRSRVSDDFEKQTKAALHGAGAETLAGFETFLSQWRLHEVARKST